MKSTLTFEEFLALDRGISIDPLTFMLHLCMCVICAYLLSRLYVRFGGSASNRAAFANTFVLLTMTTMIIITVVKSSLALSLGLVGALSIVRFRAAIKEPEELVFLFICISLGLGFGAEHLVVTLIGFALTCLIVLARARGNRDGGDHDLFVSIAQAESGEDGLRSLVDLLQKHGAEVHLHRFDQRDQELDATFRISIPSFDALDRIRGALQTEVPGAAVSFIDQGDLP